MVSPWRAIYLDLKKKRDFTIYSTSEQCELVN